MTTQPIPLPTPRRARPPARRRRAALMAGTARELVALFRATGRWWLIPMLGILALSAVVLGLVQVIEYAAPFVYTIF